MMPSFFYSSNASTLASSADPMYSLPSNTDLWFQGLKLAGSIFLAAALLELTVLDTVKAIVTKTEGGRSLYATAWVYNFINHLCLAPCVYTIGINLYASAEPCSLMVTLAYAAATIGIHSVGYYLTHRAMHTKALWWAHRYHHKFNTFICPIAAAAVTQVGALSTFPAPSSLFPPGPASSLTLARIARSCDRRPSTCSRT